MKTIKVVVVDSNGARRQVLKDLLNQSADMVCLAAVADQACARECLRELRPDVFLLDEQFLRAGVSGFQASGDAPSIPFVRIPPLDDKLLSASTASLSTPFGLPVYGEVVRKKIRIALDGPAPTAALEVMPSLSADVILPKQMRRHGKTDPVIIVGASTGGTEALKEFLQLFPANAPGILVAQHMPEMFTKSFAERLNSFCRLRVKEAEQGEKVLAGHAYIAPGHSHLMLGSVGGQYVCELSQGSPVNRHRPSVDVLFRSAANVAGRNALGVILTGMGRDGALGMQEMKQAGAYNFAQDEASCVVFGMPKEAIALGGVHEVLSLKEIAPRILAWLAQPRAIF
jgi:two-component system, chemotaxis family, protein-glutamate methylesterase/glutaminase